MPTLFRFAALTWFLCVANALLAQDLDDLFAGSEAAPLCECRHHTFSLENPPDWMPNAVKNAIAAAAHSDKAEWKGAVLFCPTTNAVIERIPLKRAYRFLVCPSDWQGFKPKKVAKNKLIESGIPIDKIRAMFQSTVMGPIEVSFRARHRRSMMGRIETENKSRSGGPDDAREPPS
ncbi:hypothetical protein Enr13x_59830 [Stieleria neptunia]|uniref:Uncharacterized protein n=1 Tax=Stieleria neptunia TaxID=2527979 RepID=A0A518HZ12_9BACT|nr:hypothetical protein [Stieleria neptunia]QDV46079.1 hypothetical protein Enr13x_59830 [Stieleria neptunia]